jgi:hypothetical protein
VECCGTLFVKCDLISIVRLLIFVLCVCVLSLRSFLSRLAEFLDLWSVRVSTVCMQRARLVAPRPPRLFSISRLLPRALRLMRFCFCVCLLRVVCVRVVCRLKKEEDEASAPVISRIKSQPDAPDLPPGATFKLKSDAHGAAGAGAAAAAAAQ